METEIMSIKEFMGRLIVSGQLPKHTRELLRTLEDLGVEVKVPSRACACLAAHTQREIILLEAQQGDSEKGLPMSVIAWRRAERFRSEPLTDSEPIQDVGDLASALRRLLDRQEAGIIPELSLFRREPALSPEEFKKQYLGEFVPGPNRRTNEPTIQEMVEAKSRLEREVDELQRDEYACNEGLAFLTVEVAGDGRFVSDKSKLKA